MNLLNDTLNRMTVDELKSIGHCLPGMPKSRPKHTLLEFLRQRLSGTGLQATWQMLDDTQRLAVAEAVHEPLGRFSEQHFSAKHGRQPRFYNPPPEGSRLSAWDRWPDKHIALCLFLHRERDGSYQVPDDLRQELLGFVAKPAPAQRLRVFRAWPSSASKGVRSRRKAQPLPGLWRAFATTSGRLLA